MLVLGSVATALLICTLCGFIISKQAMTGKIADMNYLLSVKLAQMSDMFFRNAVKSLQPTAALLPAVLDNQAALQQHLNFLYDSTNSFNAIVYVDQNGFMLGASPIMSTLIGSKTLTPGVQEALKKKAPVISKPYKANNGWLTVLISVPVIGYNGEYLGFVGGTIYLQQSNFLHQLYTAQDDYAATSIEVMDQAGYYVFHEDTKLIGNEAAHAGILEQAATSNNGDFLDKEDTDGKWIIGYARSGESNWTILTKTELGTVRQPALYLMKSMLLFSLPLIVLLMFLCWVAARRMYLPLHKLSRYAAKLSTGSFNEPFPHFSIRYKELEELRDGLLVAVRSMRKQVRHLRKAAHTDSLTGLANRRSINETVEGWQEDEIAYSVILIDLDNFKQVNDTYGHLMGDRVLIYLAEQIREIAGKDDVCCRLGGEEFMLLLPHSDTHNAILLAEKLRTRIERQISPSGQPVTLSLGVASYPESTDDSDEVFQLADIAMYHSKSGGKNRTSAAPII
jgi:diguanylate cyclase (GGDEF)-like protein